MTYQGRVLNGVVVLDEGSRLPEGTLVQVEPIEPLDDGAAGADEFIREMLEIAGSAQGLPSDLARNHDHYLHGHPKE